MTKRKCSDNEESQSDNAEPERKSKKNSTTRLKKKSENEKMEVDSLNENDDVKTKSIEDEPDIADVNQDRFPNSIPVKKTKNKKNRNNTDIDIQKTTEKVERNPDQRIKLALKYLKKWYKHKDQWKFQKVRQLCLLHHMYDHTKISDKKFKRLLLYLEGMTGASRDKTIKDAGQIVIENEIEDESDNSEETEQLDEKKIKRDRATQILHVLS